MFLYFSDYKRRTCKINTRRKRWTYSEAGCYHWKASSSRSSYCWAWSAISKALAQEVL